mgnify:CR=1 FL=1
MKILVIGASGQVGFELCRQLADTKHEVTSTVMKPEEGSSHLALDLGKIADVSAMILKVKPDVVINAAAYTAVDKAESEQELAMLVNADAVKAMAVAVKELGSTLIHYSTDYVFDGSGSEPRSEDAQTAPVNFYGKSKLDGEEYIRQSDCQHVIFRTSWVYGFHGHNFVKTMLRVGADRKELSVVSDQVGSPTSAKQIAECSIAAANCLDSDGDNVSKYVGTYHLTGSGFTNWADFAKEIFSLGSGFDEKVRGVTVKPIPSSDYPTPAKRPFNSRLDCSRLEKTFGVELDSWQSQLKGVVQEIYSN